MFFTLRIPEFEDIKDMLNNIREKGDCPLYDRFVPETDTDEFGNIYLFFTLLMNSFKTILVDYILKILQNIREKIQLQRSINFLQEYDQQGFQDNNIPLNIKSSIMPLDDFTEKVNLKSLNFYSFYSWRQ